MARLRRTFSQRSRVAAALVLTLAFLTPAIAQARWLRAESPRFVVYSNGGEAGLRAYAAKLETFDYVLRIYHDLDPQGAPPRKLSIYLVSGMGQYRRVRPSASGIYGGVYFAGPVDIFAVATRASEGDIADLIVFHEYTHHFMYQNFPYPYPAWMAEGYAEYFATTQIDGDLISVGQFNENRVYELFAGPWLPLEKLLKSQAQAMRGDAIAQFYAEAWLLTHYMLSDPARKKQMDAYVRAVGGGADPARAMEQATGEDLQALTRRLKAYRKIAYKRFRLPARTAAAITVSVLPASADELLLDNLRLSNPLPEKGRERLLEDLRIRASPFAGDRLADLTLAKAEVTYGDSAAGGEIAEIYLKKDGRDVEALRLLAQARLKAAEAATAPAKAVELRREAGQLFGRAYTLDPNQYQVLYGYALSREHDADYPSQNTLNVLLEAHALAPQVSLIKLQLAAALMRRKRFEEAIAVLGPLANHPHGGETAAFAKRFLEAAQNRQPPPSAPPKKETEDGEAKPPEPPTG